MDKFKVGDKVITTLEKVRRDRYYVPAMENEIISDEEYIVASYSHNETGYVWISLKDKRFHYHPNTFEKVNNNNIFIKSSKVKRY